MSPSKVYLTYKVYFQILSSLKDQTKENQKAFFTVCDIFYLLSEDPEQFDLTLTLLQSASSQYAGGQSCHLGSSQKAMEMDC